MPEVQGRVLDRRVPADFNHVTLYPGSALKRLQRTVRTVEKVMSLPARYHTFYDQGQEGACVGFGQSIMMSFLNRKLYDAKWLYDEAQKIDEWPDTPPQEGTSLRAGFDILRTVGHRQIFAGTSKPPKVQEGIVAVNRWLTTADEVRTAIADDMPVNIGINWYNNFYDAQPKKHGRKTEFVIADIGTQWGAIAGGHDITIGGASDARQAFALFNSWGNSFPWPCWLPYESFTRLMSEAGEAAIVTDR